MSRIENSRAEFDCKVLWVKKGFKKLGETLKAEFNAVDERDTNYAFSARHEQLPHKD